MNLFAKPLTWDRLWSLISSNKGYLPRGVYLDGDAVVIRHYSLMHPTYFSPRPWSICRSSELDTWDWSRLTKKPTRTYQENLDDGFMRSLADCGSLTYEDYSDGIEVQYKSQ